MSVPSPSVVLCSVNFPLWLPSLFFTDIMTTMTIIFYSSMLFNALMCKIGLLYLKLLFTGETMLQLLTVMISETQNSFTLDKYYISRLSNFAKLLYHLSIDILTKCPFLFIRLEFLFLFRVLSIPWFLFLKGNDIYFWI